MGSGERVAAGMERFRQADRKKVDENRLQVYCQATLERAAAITRRP